MYAVSLENHMIRTLSQFMVWVSKYMQIWVPGDLELTSEITERNSEEVRKRELLRHLQEATQNARFLSVNHISKAVESKWPNKYVAEELGLICDCYVAQATEEYRTVHLMGWDV